MKIKNALITGGSGGLGFATAALLIENGWHVYIADFKEGDLSALQKAGSVSFIPMNVTDNTSIDKAVAEVKINCQSLDAVINFAGTLKVGSVAELPVEQVQQLLDINLWGTYRVNQAFLPLLIRGRIINISSETGWQSAAPFNGPYAISKHAIEAYSDALRRELAFKGIPVIKIQPGPFKTNMVASIASQFDKAIAYSTLFKPQLQRIKKLGLKEQHHAHKPKLLAKVILKALTCQKPKAAYSVKADLMRCVLHYLPSRLADHMLKMALSGK